MATLREWLQGVEYEVLAGTDGCSVSDVIFDSRKAAPGTVFLCMTGSKTDSHGFIRDAAARGCDTFVVERELAGLDLPEDRALNVIRVGNSRRALAFLSAARFGHPADRMQLIGITGTKGKTTTSYLLRAVLEEAGYKTGVIGTNGVQIGREHFETKNTTPDSYELNSYFEKMCEAGCHFVVMECSSQGFKMDRTAGLDFAYGLFLNISPDHIGPLEHENFEEYLYLKSRLLTQCRHAIVNMDDSRTEEILKLSECSVPCTRFSLSDPTADLYAGEMIFHNSADFSGTEFRTHGILEESFRLAIPGVYNVANAMAVLAAAALIGVDAESMRRALAAISVPGRTEIVWRSDRFMVIVDYAHNELSMQNLTQTLQHYPHGRIVLVFGAGGNRARDRRTGMGRTAAVSADFSIITADNSRFEKTEDIMADIEAAFLEAGGTKEQYIKIPDRREAIRYAMKNAREGDIIAVIGKGHEDYQEENGIRHHFLDREEILKAGEDLGL